MLFVLQTWLQLACSACSFVCEHYFHSIIHTGINIVIIYIWISAKLRYDNICC